MRTATRMVVLNSKKYVLDLIFAVIAAAYSLRRLYASYTGAAIRVRRSSDNAERDIGFIGEHLDVFALLVFVGNGSGFVTTWYDQSGNGRHATQTTAANQPQIVSNGVLETINGLPTLFFDGADFMSFQGVHDQLWSLAVVGCATGNNQGFVQFGQVNQFGSMFVEAGTYRARTSTSKNATFPFTAGEIAVLTATYGATQTNIWKNGVIGNPTSEGGVASNAGSFIGVLGAFFSLNGNISEIIALNGVLFTTNRQTLERNQGLYYNISVS
jgi:trimeric autotransporter adhesin